MTAANFTILLFPFECAFSSFQVTLHFWLEGVKYSCEHLMYGKWYNISESKSISFIIQTTLVISKSSHFSVLQESYLVLFISYEATVFSMMKHRCHLICYISESVSTLLTLILTSVRVLITSQIDKKIKGDQCHFTYVCKVFGNLKLIFQMKT